jgi:PucR family transcriptional regulator, purine catabolism regulatory protein
MGVTVRQLVDTPHLRTRFAAGQAGAEQVINWAHSCELDNPWDWLEAFDLLMTNGLGVPDTPPAQARYIERLADAGISAIAIGEEAAPKVSAEMIAAAERRALPILVTAYEVPFTALARVVADSRASGEEQTRLANMARIYERVRAAAAEGRAAGALFLDLGRQLSCRLDVLDTAAWRYCFAPSEAPGADTRQVLSDTLARHADRLPAVIRLEVNGGAALIVPVPSRRPTALVASAFHGAIPELSVLQHVSTVAAMEVEKLVSQREQRYSLGSDLLADMLQANLDTARATTRLARADMPTTNLLVAAWHYDRDNSGRGDIHQELYARNIEHLLRTHGQLTLALLPADEEAIHMLLEVLPPAVSVGVSAVAASPDRIRNAAREARWALWNSWNAHAGGSRITRYGEGASISMPVNLSQADHLIEHVLGPLLRYDSAHHTELILTLAAFLRCNRSATAAAAELLIHRQTLLYRVRRIEQLSARSLGRMEDLVEFWLALRALEVVEGRNLLGSKPSWPSTPRAGRGGSNEWDTFDHGDK